jgi:uncharacterized membrane protein
MQGAVQSALRQSGGSLVMARPNDTRPLLRAAPYLLWPVAVILIIVEETKQKKDRELRHHAYNALGFAFLALVLSIPLWLLSWIPIFGQLLVLLYWIGIILFALMCALRAYNGKKVSIPFTTAFLHKNVRSF